MGREAGKQRPLRKSVKWIIHHFESADRVGGDRSRGERKDDMMQRETSPASLPTARRLDGGRSPELLLFNFHNSTIILNKKSDEKIGIQQCIIEQQNFWTNRQSNKPLLNRCSPTKLLEQLNKFHPWSKPQLANIHSLPAAERKEWAVRCKFGWDLAKLASKMLGLIDCQISEFRLCSPQGSITYAKKLATYQPMQICS